MKHDYGMHEIPSGFWRSRYAVGLLVIGAVAGYFLLTEHTAHVLGALPYLLFLACPLMHLFMHRGHSGNDEHGTGNQENSHGPR
ncbi:DUF2933 domain-containing protein [Azotobacter vinelandii]|uniref:DUF2933 domain-containing protein n=1 Tax=Azotobacter vinelandii TaxID=354 RepID=UPI002664FED4|nr:DUF2933 domain-containing protein [Azotobacter vinelandii]WKN19717.1 DUF2933 domain-containing protein [Azotobacter vinelandii]